MNEEFDRLGELLKDPKMLVTFVIGVVLAFIGMGNPS